ncbi:MAG: hypothetical protein JXQ27_15790 [Acidobacteria bacterium]|nr:hypothetical protein [Acidobacteriota bacterium]
MERTAGAPQPDSTAPDPTGRRGQAWAVTYRAPLWGRLGTVTFILAVGDGWLTVDGARCAKHQPGLFFTFDGEALYLRGTVSIYRNISLIRTPDLTPTASD